MDFLVFLIGFVLLIIIFPLLRCLFKRIVCLRKIQRVCHKKNYKIHKTHCFWFLGNKHTKKCDCYIETSNEVFSIKFFGMSKRLSVLILKENGEYFIRTFIAMISYAGSSVRFPINHKPRSMPLYDFRYKYREEWELKTPRKVLLVNPVSMEFRRQTKNGSEIIVDAGDVVNGMEIDSLPRLIGDLENAI